MEFETKIDAVTRQVVDHFSKLGTSQLNWKSEPSQWSIGQCLDHIMVSNTTYFNTFDNLLKGEYRLSFFQKLNPFKKSLGPMMVKTLGPQPDKKFKAPKLFEPSTGDVRSTIINDFVQHQELLKNHFIQLNKLNISNIVIASPVSSLITYTLEDAMKIITGHEQRHVNQALRVLNHPNFSTL